METNNEQLTFQSSKQWLTSEYTKRCKRNAQYSIRAFSKLLNLDSSTVSQILSGKRRITKKMLKRLCEAIGVSPEVQAQLNAIDNNPYDAGLQLSIESFTIISQWYHYAILELTFIEGFESNSKWIATKLNISTVEVNEAIERMIALGLLERRNKKLFKTKQFLTNIPKNITSKAHKDLQRNVLEMGLQAIDETPQEEKDITSMTLAVNEEQLEEARELIKKFRRDITKLLETGSKQKVYHLGVQLYPISK